MPSSAPVLTYRAKELASNIQSKVLKVHNTLININITAISAPEMTYTPKKFGVSRSSIRDWEKYFESDGNLLSLSQDLITKLEIMRQKKELRKLSNPPKSENDILREQNARLKKALEYSELRNEALLEVLKIGKEEYGLDLLKKAGVKQ